MRNLNSKSVLMRIYLGESDISHGKPLYQIITEMLRSEKIAGATVFRGILGFGAKSHMHTANILRLSQDLPVVIEAVDSEENINRILSEVKKLMSGGLITTENIKVLLYEAK